MIRGMTTSWRRGVTYLVLIYLAIGFLVSFVENIWGVIKGGPSAFIWTGSLAENAILLFWWFIIPALTWPIDLYWMIYHKVL
jgi:hypothetical protein